ncbi:hypothetical protein [Sulfuricurvum sp.]|uniref:hypothetical protein n=1 Tax=Sulfuricurvum sp. TaxID=2025608 RepID=UPI00261D0FA7|nr:hypothetical protein [Sulfuricurvum sp.]MDD2267634.1 hypothetical protein [Sulfuricurvum sp.]MDD2784974.1 hypothetical protein [Sulfuricurvum sp.]
MDIEQLKDKLAEAIRENKPDSLSIALDLIEMLEEDRAVILEKLRQAKIRQYFGGELQDFKEDTSRLYQGGSEKGGEG